MNRRPPDEAFFNALAIAPSRILLLDYDGTLAPFQVERMKALPYSGMAEALQNLQIAGHTRVAIISGRILSELDHLLDIEPMPELWGSHGWEHQVTGRSPDPLSIPSIAEQGLAAAKMTLKNEELMPHTEVKPAGIALHWRGLDDETQHRVFEAGKKIFGHIATTYALECHLFNGGMELRIPGKDKGTAVREILAGCLPDTFVTYLGDDLTDEDAFRVLESRGHGILVSGTWRPTAARYWLRPPEELLQFLRQWNDVF